MPRKYYIYIAMIINYITRVIQEYKLIIAVFIEIYFCNTWPSNNGKVEVENTTNKFR